MNKFIAIIGRSVTPKSHETLFKFFERMPHGVHFIPGVIAFSFNGSPKQALDAISEHLDDEDEVTILQLQNAAVWKYDRLLGGDEKDRMMRNFLSDTTGS